MDLKIAFTTRDNGNAKKNLYASIKYDGGVEDVSLNKMVTDEELKSDTPAIHTFLKTVRETLNDIVETLKREQKTVTAAAIKQYFLEHDKELFA